LKIESFFGIELWCGGLPEDHHALPFLVLDFYAIQHMGRVERDGAEVPASICRSALIDPPIGGAPSTQDQRVTNTSPWRP
jgi:hypothetical protein